MENRRPRNKNRKSKKQQKPHSLGATNCWSSCEQSGYGKSTSEQAKQKTNYSTYSEMYFNKDNEGEVSDHEEQLKHFRRMYQQWEKERQQTLCKLKELKKELHEDLLNLNMVNVTFKELNLGARKLKTDPNQNAFNFLASLASVVTEVGSGVTSVVQACKIDKYTETYNEILEKDAFSTKSFYAERSKCLSEYVEEINRCLPSATFSSTMENIADTLRTKDFCSDLTAAYDKSDTQALCRSIDEFASQNMTLKVLGSVSGSLRSYVDDNPASVEACKSLGLAVYDGLDCWKQKSKKSDVQQVVDRVILGNKEKELYELKHTVNEYEPQAKLEIRVQNTIDSFTFEYEKMRKEYHDTF